MQKSRVDLRTHYNQNKQTKTEQNRTELPCKIKEYNQVLSPSHLHGLLLSLSPVPPPKKRDKSCTALARQN
jgi:hypothetical protein